MKTENKFRIWDGSKMEYNIMVGVLGVFYVQGINETDSACLSPYNTKVLDDTPLMRFYGKVDKNKVEIYEGDVIELVNCDNQTIRVLCEYGTVQREILGLNGDSTLCDITGFYFRNQTGRATFPIFENYLGKNDVEIFEVIGNIYENPDLWPHFKK